MCGKHSVVAVSIVAGGCESEGMGKSEDEGAGGGGGGA